MTINMLVGTNITCKTISPAVLGLEITDQLVKKIMIYDEARKIDPDLINTNKAVYNSMHLAHTPDVSEMIFMLLANNKVYAIDWIDVDTIEVSASLALLTITIPNGTQLLAESLNDAFTNSGILNYNIEQTLNIETNILAIRIEISYGDILLKNKVSSIIQKLGIKEYIYNVHR